MNDSGQMALALVAGLAAGVLFFGGLWLTVSRSLKSKAAPILFLGSFFVRSALVLAAFYWVGHGHFYRLLAALAGFVAVRLWATRKLGGHLREATGEP